MINNPTGPAFGISPTGCFPKQLPDILSQMQEALQSDLGPGFTLVPNTPEGQLFLRVGEQVKDLWDFGVQVFQNRFPATASGNSLDNALSLVNVQRRPATASVVNNAVITGVPGTVLDQTFQVSVSGNPGAVFNLYNPVTIGPSGTVLAEFVCTETGPITAPAGTLTSIVTQVAGVTGVTNPTDAQVGTNAESDSVYFQRSLSELGALGSSTVSGIKKALEAVPNVSLVRVIVNDSAAAAVAEVFTVTPTAVDNTVYTVTINGVNYSITSGSSTTATLICNALRAAITDATVVTSGTSTLIVTAATAGDVFALTVGPNLSQVLTTAPVLRPHSVLAIVTGGADSDIYNALLEAKGAGIDLNGSQSTTMYDSGGNAKTVRFARAYPVSIYIGVVLTVNTNPALGPVFPTNGTSQVQNAIIAFGGQYIYGQTVVLQAFNNPIFSVPGVLTAAITISASPTPFPPVATSPTLAISPNQVAAFTAGNTSVTAS